MKKKLLSLENLKVKSFVTSLDEKGEKTVKGGAETETNVFKDCGVSVIDGFCSGPIRAQCM